MFNKRLVSVFVSFSAGLFALAAVLALAQHPAGVAWAAPENQPLATTITVGFGCGSIQACIDAANPGDEVHIPAGLYTESVTVAKAISITGDLSSTTIIHAPDLQRVMLITGTSVYVSDLTMTGGTLTTTGGADYPDYGGALAVLSSTVTLQDVTASTNTANRGGAVAGLYSTLTLTGVSLYSNTAASLGGALYVYTGTVATVDNTQFISNTATDFYGTGGIYSAGTLTVTNSAILNTIGVSIWNNQGQALLAGSVISNSSHSGFLNNYGQALITGTTIANNPNGGIWSQADTDDDGTLLTVVNSQFSGNAHPTSSIGGGAISNLGGRLAISSSTFISNSAFAGGGGLYSNTGAGTTIWDSTFSDNQNGAIFNFGAPSLSPPTLSIDASVFSNNHASDLSGGITNRADRLIISGTTFVSNTSSSTTYPGGAIYIYDGSLGITGSSFYSNSTTAGGGAMTIDSSPATITNSLFVGNYALKAGGALQTAGDTSVFSTTFSGNQSGTNGGAIFAFSPLTLTNSTLVSNTAATEGGALYVYTGTVATVDNTQFISNTATASGGTGGIYSAGTLTVTNSSLLNTVGLSVRNDHGQVTLASSLISNSSGLGLYNFKGSALITGSTIANNLTGGVATEGGAYDGTILTVDNSLFSGNRNTNPLMGGGAIGNTGGLLVISSSTFISNSASGQNQGGAILSFLGAGTTIWNSTFTGNQDGAIFNSGTGSLTATLSIADSLFSSNQASYGSAGLTNEADHLIISDSTFVSNTSTSTSFPGGAISNNSWGLSISGSTFSSNTTTSRGGAIYNLFGPLTITNSTLVSNTATGQGGGLYVYTNTQTLIDNVSLAGNHAVSGGGIFAAGSLTITNSTLVSNMGDGVLNTGSLLVASSVISGNMGPGLDNEGGTTIITETTFTFNVGDGISSTRGLTISNSMLISNTLDGVRLGSNGQSYITGTLMAYNQLFGLFSHSSLSLISSTLLSNTLGGMAADGPQTYISSTSFISNTGDGGALLGRELPLTHSTVVIIKSQFVSNSATSGTGGALTFAGLDQMTVTASLFLDNSSSADGGAILGMGGGVLVQDSTLIGNSAIRGGAIHSGWILHVTGSTLMSNTAALAGGGIYNTYSVVITDSTISGNSSAGHGGGLYDGYDYSDFVGADASLNNVTLAGNIADQDNNGSGDGGGLYVTVTSTVRLSNTLIANNQDLGGQASDCSGTLTTGGHNLIQTTTGCTLSGTASGDITNTAALLGPLQDNGGPTLTQALLAGSPAIDAGSPAVPGSGGSACEAADQRGTLRPQGFACDIGAYEAVGLSLTGTVQFASSAYSAAQSAGTVPITVTLSQALPVTATVQYSTTNGSALTGQDYLAASGTLTFTPGLTQTSFAVAVLPVAPGGADRAFTVALAAPTVATLGAPATATVTIHNDAAPPVVALSSSQYTVPESAGSVLITATLSTPSQLTATVQYSTTNSTALAGSDYTAVSGTLTFTPGLTQTTFVVALLPDGPGEPDQAFTVTLAAPANATLGAPAAATVTIHDDAAPPAVALSSSQYTVTESGGSAVITVTLSAASSLTATVHYAASNGSATASDYTPVSGTLTFAPGQTAQTFSVPISNDAQVESSETIQLTLSAPTQAVLGSPSAATLTILDDDVEFKLYLPLIQR